MDGHAMDAGDLRIFEAVARLGGMSPAASELNTVQSNVTARMRRLEARLGVVLFRRHSRGVALTPAGERLLPYARRLRALLDEARDAVGDDGTPRGRLTIGSLETTAALRLSPVLARFAAAHPAVDLALVTGTTAEMVEATRAGRVAGAFVCGPVAGAGLVSEPLFHEELVLVTASGRDAPDGTRRGDGVKILVLRAGCSYRQRLEDLLARRGLTGPRLMEFGTLETILACVGAGIGVTLLPRAVVAAAARAGRVALHALAPDEARAETLFVRRADAHRSSALDAFLALARPATAEMTKAARASAA